MRRRQAGSRTKMEASDFELGYQYGLAGLSYDAIEDVESEVFITNPVLAEKHQRAGYELGCRIRNRNLSTM
jgi:hypothetical protein